MATIRNKIILLLFAVLLAAAGSLTASPLENLRFRQFSTPQGLPSSMVHQVYQDRDGFIWISSYYGLFRYDGYEIHTVKSNIYTPGILVNNNVICVEEDYSHNLWIGTHEGLNILDKQTGEIREMKLSGVSRHRVNDIHVTGNNTVYVGYIRGLAYYDAVQDTLILMSRRNCTGEAPEQVNIQAIAEDDNGDLLIGTWDAGLFRYILRENRFVHYPATVQSPITSIFMDSEGRVWMGTSGNGLQRVFLSADKATLSVDSYRHDPDNSSSVSSDHIYSVAEDPLTNSLWLATRNGVSIMNLNTENSFVNYKSSDSRHFLPAQEVNSVLRDSNGLMWAGSKGAGIFVADTRESTFKTIFPADNGASFSDYISTLYVEDNGALWVGFGYGINYYHNDKTINVLPSKRPYHISYSKSTGEVLLALQDEGIIACRNGKIIRRYTSLNCGFVPNNLVFTVYDDKGGNWWVGSYTGLGVRYADGREFRISQLAGADELLKKEITSITSDKDGYLWLATNNNGIVRVTGDMNDPSSFLCKNYSMENGLLPVNTPLCFLIDAEGRVWAGTEGSGLCIYDPDNDSFESVHMKYHLPGDMAGSIEEDEHGNLWVGTNQGLAKITFTDGGESSTWIFTVADGLPDNFFNTNASVSRNGIFYFGSSRGIVSFKSDIEDIGNTDISLRITDILIDGKPLGEFSSEKKRKITSFTPDFTNNLVIPHAYRNFTVRFASLTYNMPRQNKYAYRLAGFDTDWNYTDADNRSAYYSNLRPGSYTLELRATNENGDWGAVREMIITVKPPFWATWWALVIYLLLAAGIIWLILSEARRRLALRNRLRLQELETAKVQELNHIKLQFFTNITHELMTPLTIISAALDELKERLPKFGDLYNTMDVNVQRLIRLLQQILEFRKAESGNLKLRVAKGDLAAFVRREAESFEPLVRKQRINFSVVCEHDVMEGYFDRDKLDKILYNLLSNAAKYNRKDGYIQLSVKYSDTPGFAVISVKDNGEGIPEERLQTLFRRFYDGDYRQFHTIGTGIGLSLTRDLVELHRGSIGVDSEVGKGTRFTVEIPIEKEAYNDEEIIDLTEESDSKNRIADQPEHENLPEPSQQPAADAPCILLAEDNEDLLSVMYRLLSREYRVLTAADGREALDMAANENISLIVSDVVMPVMGGIELTKHIKNEIELCHIPVILLTAKSAEEDRDEGYTAGADAYLTKPFNLSALHARIKSLLKAKERTANDFKKRLAFEIKELDYTDTDQKFLENAIGCVNRHLDDPEFDVPLFIAEMATSRTTLYKKLKSLTGLNTTAFIRNVRLKAACRIMDENKNIRVSDLAYMVGFNDPKYFSVCFRKEFGMQPSEYMERYSGN